MKFITLTISFLFAINLKAQKGNESVVDTDNDNEITKVFRATTERTKITSTEYFLKFTRMKDADFFKLFKTADLETANRLGIHEGAVYLSGGK